MVKFHWKIPWSASWSGSAPKSIFLLPGRCPTRRQLVWVVSKICSIFHINNVKFLQKFPDPALDPFVFQNVSATSLYKDTSLVKVSWRSDCSFMWSCQQTDKQKIRQTPGKTIPSLAEVVTARRIGANSKIQWARVTWPWRFCLKMGASVTRVSGIFN